MIVLREVEERVIFDSGHLEEFAPVAAVGGTCSNGEVTWGEVDGAMGGGEHCVLADDGATAEVDVVGADGDLVWVLEDGDVGTSNDPLLAMNGGGSDCLGNKNSCEQCKKEHFNGMFRQSTVVLITAR